LKKNIIVNMAVIFAFIALIGWGVGDLLIAKISRKIGNFNTLFWLLFSGLIFASFYIPIAGAVADWGMFLLALLLGFITCSGTIFYLRGFEFGNVSIIATIANTYGVVTAVAAIFLFGEILKTEQSAGIVLVLIGLVLISFDFKMLRKNKIKGIVSDRTIVYAFITVLFWGVYYTLIRIPVEKIGWFWAGFPAYLYSLAMIASGKLKRDVFNIFSDKKLLLTIIIYSILVNGAFFAYNLGISFGYTSVVAPIVGSTPILLVILSRIFFHEPLNRQQKAGIGFALLGIMLIGISSV